MSKIDNEGRVLDIVIFTDLHEACLDNLLVGPATFLRDFGHWKKDQVLESLMFDFDNGVIKEYDDGGNIVKQCQFTLIEVKGNDDALASTN